MPSQAGGLSPPAKTSMPRSGSGRRQRGPCLWVFLFFRSFVNNFVFELGSGFSREGFTGFSDRLSNVPLLSIEP